mmetsp:Transcript_13319/g.35365  ORF Transcript_13319/g.35365 Transcript_13319/m.35365 type:complete len:207 (+) Transcript_13319:198-818(+)
MPALNVRTSSSSGKPPHALRNHSKRGGSAHGVTFAIKWSGSTLGKFSVRPPPVMWAAPRNPGTWRTAPIVDAYNRVGASNTDANVSSPPAPTLDAGASNKAEMDVFCCLANLASAFLTSENPFACTPLDETPINTSPACIDDVRGNKSRFLTAPTQKPATSKSPAPYNPGISAVSPPDNAQPLFAQPSATPSTKQAQASTSNAPVA